MPSRAAKENSKRARRNYHGKIEMKEEEEEKVVVGGIKPSRTLRQRSSALNRGSSAQRENPPPKRSDSKRGLRTASKANSKAVRPQAGKPGKKPRTKTKPRTKRDKKRKNNKREKNSDSCLDSPRDLPSVGGRTSILEYEHIELAEGRLHPLFYCFHNVRSPPIVQDGAASQAQARIDDTSATAQGSIPE